MQEARCHLDPEGHGPAGHNPGRVAEECWHKRGRRSSRISICKVQCVSVSRPGQIPVCFRSHGQLLTVAKPAPGHEST